MPVPIVCLDGRLGQFAARFAGCFSAPQRRHLVTVLLALVLCREARTLSGLGRQVVGGGSVAALSRFLSDAPWSAPAVAATWQAHFASQMAPLVAAEHQWQRQARPPRRGRPPTPRVTGSLIGDDSTMPKPKGRKMEGIGRHYSTTAGRPVVGHSLVQGLYVLGGRRCPLAPRLYRQQAVCAAEGVPFHSKIDLMVDLIGSFTPVAGTQTHVLVDSWYAAKRLWKTARERGFLITSGLKSNRQVRIDEAEAPGGWRWQSLAEYAAGLSEADYQAVVWPSQEAEPRQVWVHVVQTRVKKLYRCQVLLVKESRDAPAKEVRFFASSDLQADVQTLVGHVAARWAIEVLFADGKELLGLDQYQVMSAAAIVKYWTLAWATFSFLEEERADLRAERMEHVTLGEARCAVQRRQWQQVITSLHQEITAGVTVQTLIDRLAA